MDVGQLKGQSLIGCGEQVQCLHTLLQISASSEPDLPS